MPGRVPAPRLRYALALALAALLPLADARAQGSPSLRTQGLRALPCPDFRKAVGGAAAVRLVAVGGPAWDGRDLRPGAADAATVRYAGRRDASEKLLPGLSTQVRLERDLTRAGLYGALGLGYDLYLAKATLATDDDDRVVDASRARLHTVTPAGQLGYRHVIGERGAALFAAAELGYELTAGARGRVVAPLDDAAPDGLEVDALVAARPGLRYGARAGASVPFGPGLALTGEVHYRLGGQAAGGADLVDYRYRRFGVTAGVTFDL